ncbi:MAG: antitoxin [Gemmatimonadales bacterium]
MAIKAKLFRNGGSQAVRLPKECRFPDDHTEVLIRREGNRLIIEPVDEWAAEFRTCLAAWDGEIERPRQTPVQKHKNPFD